ncbi:CD109 antigen isoform X2 [Lingula anatina]|uniref:CD109 antigen isoform X2 n=1 Tax=Lingula anatina TaxID=7574 RepID=A0A1S3HU34_LINAN|nr:CD109 antigen isoform X2 [Lingula anatina]|eukprot:XP_013389533.1 CD109 antigen isoform X2 [Lingula anatina]
MWTRPVFGAVVAAMWIACAYGYDSSYIMISPRRFRPGLTYDISVSILKLDTPNLPVTITAVIDRNGTAIAGGVGVFRLGSSGTLSIQVPRDIEPVNVYRYYTYYGDFKLKVIGNGGLTFTNETWLQFDSKSLSIFTQTDKGIYQPGQTVRFRAFATGPDLKPIIAPMTVEIYDARENRVKQMIDVQGEAGIVSSEMALPSEPVLGDWKIKVKILGESKETEFEVDEYVLPKFEVKVELPPYILEDAPSITGKVVATYTYGKPVEGTVTLRAVPTCCKKYRYNGTYGVEQRMVLDKVTGEASFTLLREDLLIGHNNIYGIEVKANVTETLTGITLSGEESKYFVNSPYKVEWLQNSPSSFKPGLAYKGYVKVTYQDDTPLGKPATLNITSTVRYKNPNPDPTPSPPFIQPVPLKPVGIAKRSIAFPGPWWYDPLLSREGPSMLLSIPEDGIVEVTLTPPSDAQQMDLRAEYEKRTGYRNINRMHSPSDSYLQLLVITTDAVAGQYATFAVTTTEQVDQLNYQVLARGEIAASGVVTLTSSSTFRIPLTSSMAPRAQMVVYYVRPDGEIVNDGVSFNVEGAIQNMVSLNASRSEAEPGQSVDLRVRADPNSVVCLLAVDQSVLLLNKGNDITKDGIMEEVNQYGGFGFYPGPFYRYWWPYSISGTDAKDVFNNAGVIILTDALVYEKIEERHWYLTTTYRPTATFATTTSTRQPATTTVPPVVSTPTRKSGTSPRVRQFFPEAWIWDTFSMSSSGMADMSVVVPDTITSWSASAFAVNPVTGLGVVDDPSKIRVFRPFFVSFNLPYSVTRGEEIILQAVVFNYMDRELNVKVTLPNTGGFLNIVRNMFGEFSTSAEEQVLRIKVPANTGKSVFFPIVPVALGRIDVEIRAQSNMAADAVRRQLLVEAEGLERELNRAMIVDLSKSRTFSANVDLALPQGVVQGSARASVSVIGDLIGNIVENLEHLMRLPSGCGEQTMAALAPDVFVAKYFKALGQLVEPIKSKLIGFMEKGVMREITYQHPDGSYSAWGPTKNNKKGGSTWLTAFVMKIFHQIKEFTFVDDEVLRKGLQFLINNQAENGSFPEVGSVHSRNLQGGSGKGAPLTAFVLIALKENDDAVNANWTEFQRAISSAVSFLENQLPSLNDPYPLAIVTYALHLAKSPVANMALNKLNAMATYEDGYKYWKIADTPRCEYRYCYNPPTQEVETAGYALFVHNAINNEQSIPILKYLVSKQNSYGSFGSTQDTVVALQALTEYVALYATTRDMTIRVTAGGSSESFTVNDQNALVLQRAEFPDIPQQATISARGSGSALVQVTVKYNVMSDKREKSFDLNVTVLEESDNAMKLRVCTRYLKAGKTGMAIEQIQLPGGFDADMESLKDVEFIQRVEKKERKVVLYLDEIDQRATCVDLTLYRSDLVAKTQPAIVKVTDYYSPGNEEVASYSSEKLEKVNICDLCKENCEVCLPQFSCRGKGNGLHRDDRHCDRFYYCFYQKVYYAFKCPKGYLFNGLYCDFASKVTDCNVFK